MSHVKSLMPTPSQEFFFACCRIFHDFFTPSDTIQNTLIKCMYIRNIPVSTVWIQIRPDIMPEQISVFTFVSYMPEQKLPLEHKIN